MSSATSDAGQAVISPVPTAVEITAAATSRRARRMAETGAPAAQEVSVPVVRRSRAEQVANVPAPTADAVVLTPVAPVADAEPVVEVLTAEVVAIEAPAVEAPVSEAPIVIETPASDIDVFAAASEIFGFAPVDDAEADADVPEVPVDDEAVTVGATPDALHVAPRRRRVLRQVAAAGASFGIMGVAGLIAVSMTLPVSAVAAVQGADSTLSASIVASETSKTPMIEEEEIQAFVASDGVQDETLARSESFSTVSLLDVAAEEGIRYSDSLYTNDPNAAIQWPFMVGVAMSSTYGSRNGRMHAGIDLVPGAGAQIQAIADGTVRIATESGGAYGVNAYVDHVIDGQVVTSHYAHMQYGSLQVKAGQKVKVGDPIGKVGNTGRSYGAHLHFEIIINGSTVNPLTWMRNNAGRYEY